MRHAFGRAVTVGSHLLLGTLGLTVLSGLAPAAAASLLRHLVELLQRGSPTSTVIVVGIAASLSGAVGVLAPASADLLLRRLTGLMKVEEHDEVFRALNAQEDMGQFDEPEFHAHLTLARERGVDAAGEVVDASIAMLQSLLLSLGFVTVLCAINPLLVAAAATVAVPMVAIEISLRNARIAAMKDLNAHQRERFLYTQAMAGYREAKEVRLLAIGDHLRLRARSRFRDAVDVEHRLARRELRKRFTVIALSTAFSLALIVWAVVQYRHGALTLGDLTVVATAGTAITQGLSGAVGHLGRLRQGLEIERVLDELRTPAGDAAPARSAAVPALASALELQDVSFRYAGQTTWALHHVDLRIGADQLVAMVGANGSGKSTLVKLCCRLYDPTEGVVLWDGVDARTYTHASLRARMGVLFQDFVTYEVSAAENIGIGDVAAFDDPQRVDRAARLAGADEMVRRLPRGYATRLSRLYPDPDDEPSDATGVMLSGGQAQRLSIARLLMRADADLLILDEPTSGLDPDAEVELLETLRRTRAGKATVLVTHRLGAARRADLIVVVADGTIVERGNHDELLALDGEYARLFRLQAAGFEAPVLD